MKALKEKPQIVLKNGKPDSVILSIKTFEEMLNRLEDREDLEELKKMRKKPLKFRRLDDFLAEYKPRVRNLS